MRDCARPGGEPARPAPPRELATGLGFRLAGLFGSGILRLWGATLSIDWRRPENLRAIDEREGRVVYALWHGNLLTLAYTHRDRGVVMLVSRHKDGEIISQIICRLGYGVVRGSSTRGGARALLSMARAGRDGCPLGVTPDGPRGPVHQIQAGILHIAQRSGLPLAPVAVEAVRRTRLASWDRFLIPHPWSRVTVVHGPLVFLPPDLDAEELEREWGPRLAAALADVEAEAAAWRVSRVGPF